MPQERRSSTRSLARARAFTSITEHRHTRAERFLDEHGDQARLPCSKPAVSRMMRRRRGDPRDGRKAMTSTNPSATNVPARGAAGGAKRMTLASLIALLVSVGGNVLQWRTANAEYEKIQQEQKEASTRSIQSWIEQLQKFDTVEDRVMVLSAAVSTSQYESVRAWARDQMVRLEGELDERKKVAQAQVAMTEAAPPPATEPSSRPPGTRSHPATPPQTAPAGEPPALPPAAAPVAARDADIQRVARKNLERVNLAETLLRAARADVRPAPVSTAAPSGQ